MTVSIETLEALLDASFRFTQALYDDKDPHKAISGFTGIAFSGMGTRSLVRNPVSQQHSYGMNMGDKDGVMPAFASSRLIAQADLAKPGKEIERAMLNWEREANVGRDDTLPVEGRVQMTC
jgi:hypothetical protein